MSLAIAERRRLQDESRLLDDVLRLVRAWHGRPPVSALDAVLRGVTVPSVPAQRHACSS